MNFHEKIRAVLSQDPSGKAIEFDGAWHTWGELAAIAARIDNALAQRGFGAGVRVGLVARNRPPVIGAFVGLLATRRCVTMIYSAQSATQIAEDISRLRVPVVVADRGDWTPDAIVAARAAGVFGLSLTSDPADPVVVVEGLGGAEPQSFDAPDPGIDAEIAMELLSSGTTGAPKRVPVKATTFELAVQDAAAVYASGRSDGEAPPNVVFQPLGNVAGVTFLIPLLAQGQAMALLEKFSLDPWLDLVRRHRPARTSLPPAVLRMILDRKIPKDALSCFATIGVGAAALDPQLQQQFESTYGIPLLVGYGATEFGGVVANWTLDLHRQFADAKRGSVGRARPGVALRIIDLKQGVELPLGEVGVLEAKVDRVGPGWIRTTDLASIDADGFLYLHGRADGVINRGGFKVIPESIAAVLRQHPKVADAVIVGIPDARLGEVPVAAIEPRDGASTLDAVELEAYARQHLIAYQVPTQFRIVEKLPRNHSMKISLPAIAELFKHAGTGNAGKE